MLNFTSLEETQWDHNSVRHCLSCPLPCWVSFWLINFFFVNCTSGIISRKICLQRFFFFVLREFYSCGCSLRPMNFLFALSMKCEGKPTPSLLHLLTVGSSLWRRPLGVRGVCQQHLGPGGQESLGMASVWWDSPIGHHLAEMWRSWGSGKPPYSVFLCVSLIDSLIPPF